MIAKHDICLRQFYTYFFHITSLFQVNVDEKIKFLTNHHYDLLNQRATLDARLKEAKAMARDTPPQHIAAEVINHLSLIFSFVLLLN